MQSPFSSFQNCWKLCKEKNYPYGSRHYTGSCILLHKHGVWKSKQYLLQIEFNAVKYYMFYINIQYTDLNGDGKNP